ncbi:outer membrane beta-barrel protein [Algoriphagus sp.]|uniref:outer membrane beta-barrel protein n=1 Tax=Algoriphagus sp. TaxID=1872435 RepID=UPI0025E52770|nr:outer membrane beta-barrel protein [Algoriphagus sp.]
MKKLLGITLLLFVCQWTIAQQAGRFRMGMDLGAAIPKGGGIGALVNLEPKINLNNKMNVGIRFGVAGLAKDVTYFDITEDYEGEISGNLSITGTFDYYFNNGGSNVAPYLGAGFGYFALSSIDIQNGDFDNPDNFGDLEADFKWAPMVRAGVELGKFRMGAEYNFVPTSNLQNSAGEVIGEAVNQYFGFTLGFYVGGGRWRGYTN